MNCDNQDKKRMNCDNLADSCPYIHAGGSSFMNDESQRLGLLTREISRTGSAKHRGPHYPGQKRPTFASSTHLPVDERTDRRLRDVA